MNQPVQQVVVNVENKSNGLGLAGLIFSCVGWLTCGALCIPGALLSFFGLFFKPRGTAVAGLIVGFPGVIFFFVMGLGMLAGMLGIGVAATGAVDQAREAARRASEQSRISPELNNEEAVEPSPANDQFPVPVPSEPVSTETTVEPTVSETDTNVGETKTNVGETKPSSMDPKPVIEPKPKVDPLTVQRTFSDKTGKFKVEATVISFGAGLVSLKRVDNGKIVTIDASKLGDADQQWLKENF